MKKKQKNEYCLKRYLMQQKWPILGFVITEVLGNIASILATLVVAECLTLFTLSEFEEGLKYFLVFFGLRVFRRICYYFGSVFVNVSTTRLSFSVRKDLTDRLFKLQSKTFASASSGLFVTRIVDDSEAAFGKISDIIECLAFIFTSFVTLVYISVLNIWVGLIFLVSAIGLSIFEMYRKKVVKKLGKEKKKTYEDVVSLTTEVVRSEKDIKALNLENRLKSQCVDAFDKNRIASKRKEKVDYNLWHLRTLLVDSVITIAIVVAVYSVAGGTMAVASLLFIFMNKDSFFDLIWYIGQIAKQITECKISSERMFEIFDEEKFPIEKFGNVKLENYSGEIEFREVSFSYEDNFEGENEETQNAKKSKKNLFRKKNAKLEEEVKPKDYVRVFEGLNFKIPANKTVAFVGKSGSGKSTILSLMSRMYKVDGGEVLLDGVNIDSLDETSIRNNISLVNQFPYIFNTTIRKNLLLAKKDAAEEELIDACKRSALWPFIQGLKRGLDTKVGESGIKLSGGQKQRLAIARALLRKSKVILFDESTSSLDNFAQEEIKTSIDALSGGCTVVIVAHRLSTIKNANIIFFLNEGQIVGQGSFEELFNNNEMFRTLFKTENI